MLLAGDGHEVTLVERDGHSAAANATGAWDSWTRSGVNQFRQARSSAPIWLSTPWAGAHLPQWLGQVGARPVPQQTEDCGYTYYTRFSRSLLTLPADNQTGSVTVYISGRDQPLEQLREPDRWNRLVARLPDTRALARRRTDHRGAADRRRGRPAPPPGHWRAALWPPVSPRSPTPGRAPTPPKGAASA
jgi:hypothetical protein